MKVVLDTRDIKLLSASGYGFLGYFDENGNDMRYVDSKKDEEAYQLDCDSGFMDKLYRCNTIDDIKKSISVKMSYSLEIKDNALILSWNTLNGVMGEYSWKFEIIFANIQ